jgi:NMD protein affecting ribosome stability and mRNA decay
MVRSIEGKHPEYYEGVLQLREIKQEVIDFAKKEIKKSGVHVAKTLKTKNGTDIFLSDNDFTRSLGKRLQQKFGGQLLVTASLFGRKSGKEIHRLTVLFRQAHFKKGNKVDFNGDEYLVKMINKDILLQNSLNGKKVHIKFNEIKKIKLVN